MSEDAIFGCDHNKKFNEMLHLVFLRSNPDKRELVCRVEISYLIEIHKTKIEYGGCAERPLLKVEMHRSTISTGGFHLIKVHHCIEQQS